MFLTGPIRFDGVGPASCHDQQARSPGGFTRCVATAGRRRTRVNLRSRPSRSRDTRDQLSMNVGEHLVGHAQGARTATTGSRMPGTTPCVGASGHPMPPAADTGRSTFPLPYGGLAPTEGVAPDGPPGEAAAGLPSARWPILG